MAVYNKAVMCRPTHFEVTYTINPWMGGVVNRDLAMAQWNTLRALLEDCGVTVDVIEQAPGLPDMVFVCNSGLVRGKRAFLSHFKHQERQGEELHYLDYFLNQGYDLHGEPNCFFEGGGDAVFSSPNRLWAGYGARTSKAAYAKIYDCFNSDPSYPEELEMIECEMIHEKYYHIDTCFLPLDDTFALYYPPAFSDAAIKTMATKINLIPVSDADAELFACNGISVRQANTVILPAGCDDTQMTLEKYGWRVKQVDLSEFMKAGGAVQCLILRII